MTEDSKHGSGSRNLENTSAPDLIAEMRVFSEVAEALRGASGETARRVLHYFGSIYGVPASDAGRSTGEPPPERPRRTFDDFPSLFDAANADGLDRVLVAAYWFQVVGAAEDFESQTLNSALKDLGHPSSNITRDLDNLMARNPKPVMQVKKAGSTKQARKRYKLTREGVRMVEALLT